MHRNPRRDQRIEKQGVRRCAVARGEATKCIAETLKLSPHTVTEHIQRACDKIGVRGRKALIARLFFDGYAPTLKAEKPTLSDALRVERRQIAV